MLKIMVNKVKNEFYNAEKNEFYNEFYLDEDYAITLEHSLLSISKWESIWHKPFLSQTNKTDDELISYVKCMTIDENVPDEIYQYLSPSNFKEVNDYIQNPMSATKFITFETENSNRRSTNKPITSEKIYKWMLSYNIPFAECQTWHLNRLLTLIRLCNIENNSNNKMKPKDIQRQNASLNKARREGMKTRG